MRKRGLLKGFLGGGGAEAGIGLNREGRSVESIGFEGKGRGAHTDMAAW